MTDNNITYQTALETIANTYPPAIGFTSPTTATSPGNQILIAQNNTIIELLVRICQKLDNLNTAQTQPTLPFQENLEQINKQLESLFVTSKRVIPKSNRQLVVWQDPRTLFPKTKRKEPKDST